MFDFAWTEIALIGVVALIAIGPKDLPVAIKAVTGAIKKARRMAGEFQTHVDEMVREANLHEVRSQIQDIRSLDVKGQILKAVDGDGELRRTLADDPFRTTPSNTPPHTGQLDGNSPDPIIKPLLDPHGEVPGSVLAPPSFIPPGTPAPPAATVSPAAEALPEAPKIPAFIPPETVAETRHSA